MKVYLILPCLILLSCETTTTESPKIEKQEPVLTVDSIPKKDSLTLGESKVISVDSFYMEGPDGELYLIDSIGEPTLVE